jgi:hypothetical protein
VLDPLGVQIKEPSGSRRGPDRKVVDVIPAVATQARGIAQRHGNLVGEGDRRDEVPRGAVPGLGQGEQRRDDIARMKRLEREVRVVEIEVAHGDAVGEAGDLGTGSQPGSPDRGSPRIGMRSRVAARGLGRVLVECRRRHADRVEDAALDLVDHLGRKAVPRRRRRVLGEHPAVSVRHPRRALPRPRGRSLPRRSGGAS